MRNAIPRETSECLTILYIKFDRTLIIAEYSKKIFTRARDKNFYYMLKINDICKLCNIFQFIFYTYFS